MTARSDNDEVQIWKMNMEFYNKLESLVKAQPSLLRGAVKSLPIESQAQRIPRA